MRGISGERAQHQDVDEALSGVYPAPIQLHMADYLTGRPGAKGRTRIARRDERVDQVRDAVAAESSAVDTTYCAPVLRARRPDLDEGRRVHAPSLAGPARWRTGI